MSGSSSSNPGSDGGYSLDCEAVSFRTQLRSIPPEAIGRIDVGTVLPVKSDNGKVVAVHPEDGDFVGSIAYSKNVELIRCMAEGFKYEATILEIDDGLVTVQVTIA